MIDCLPVIEVAGMLDCALRAHLVAVDKRAHAVSRGQSLGLLGTR